MKCLYRSILMALTMIACWTISACEGPTIGPRVETRTVVVYPGQPLQILRNVTVTGRRLGDDVQVEQDVGGWVCMPREHFDALVRERGLQPAHPPGGPLPHPPPGGPIGPGAVTPSPATNH